MKRPTNAGRYRSCFNVSKFHFKNHRNFLIFFLFLFCNVVFAAPPSDPTMQIRLNQLGFFPSATKTATLLVDHKFGEEPSADTWLYHWEVVRLSDNTIAHRAPSGFSNAADTEKYVHSLPAGHVGPSDRYFVGDADKYFYNPTNQVMYQWDITALSAEGAYRVQVRRQSVTTGATEIWYQSPEFTISRNGMAAEYSSMARDAFNYYYFHRLGEILKPQDMRAAGINDIYQRPQLHGDGYPCQKDWCGVGVLLGAGTAWADAGDFGVYPVNHAMAAWQMLNSVEFMDSPRDLAIVSSDVPIPDDEKVVDPDSNQRVKVLEEVIHGSQYFKNLLPPDTELLAPHKIHNDTWGEGLSAWTYEVENGYKAKRRAAAPSTASTLAICRTSAHISRLLFKYGYNSEANEWRQLANDALSRADKLPLKLYYRPEVADPNTGASGPLLFNGGGPYNDGNVTDDFYACNVERYLTLLAARNAGESVSDAALNTARSKVITNGWFGIFPEHFDWKDVAGAANISLLTGGNDLSVEQVATLETNLVERAKLKLDLLEPYSQGTLGGFFTWNPRLPTTLANITDNSDPANPKPGYWYWGSNSFVVNDAQLLAVASRYVKGSSELSKDMAQASLHAMDYILGENAINLSFVTGYGEYAEEDTHDRHAWTASGRNMADNPNPAPYPRGWLSGGPQNDWQTCIIKEYKEDYMRPYEAYSPFFVGSDGTGFVSADEVWVSLDATDQTTLLEELYADQYKNLPLSTNIVPLGSDGLPLSPTAPANAYAAIRKADNGWCTKENTINWNSGLLWMATAASNFLPTQIGDEPDVIPPPDLRFAADKFLRPQEEWPPGGECADIVVTNLTNETLEWTVNIQVKGDVYEFWNAQWVQDGNLVTVSAADEAWWGKTLGPRQSTDPSWFGYCSAGTPEDRDPTPPPSGDVVQVDVYDDFNGGFCADVTVTNYSNQPWTWKVPITITNGTLPGTIDHEWNFRCLDAADNTIPCEGLGGTVTIAGFDWNGTLAPAGDAQNDDQTQSLGFCANK